MKHIVHVKIIAVFICCMFFIMSVVQASPSVYEITVTEEQGKVTQRYKAEDGSDKMVVHIQDAHANLDAQVNLANIICSLLPQISEEKNPFIGIEGAVGAYDLKQLRDFPFTRIRESVAQEAVRQGMLVGAELASVIAKQDFTLFGLEDQGLFNDNYRAFYTVMQRQEDIEKEIEKIEGYLELLKDAIFRNSLKKFHDRAAAYERGDVAFTDYLATLYEKIDVCDIDYMQYLNLQQFKELFWVGKNIDHEMLRKEMMSVGEAVLVKNVHASDIAGMFADYVNGTVSEKDMVITVRNAAFQAGIDLEGFEQLRKAYEYWSRFALIDFGVMIREVQRANGAVRKVMSVNKDEALLVDLWSNVVVLKQLVQLKVLKEDIDMYRKDKMKYSIPFILKGIQILADRNGIDLKVSDPVADIDEILALVEEFYAIAEKRNAVLVNNLLVQMDAKNQDTGVLVAGGFHSDGMLEILKEKGVSYVTVAPQINSLGESAGYMNRMMGQLPGMHAMAMNSIQLSRFNLSGVAACGELDTQQGVGLVVKTEKDIMIKDTVNDIDAGGDPISEEGFFSNVEEMIVDEKVPLVTEKLDDENEENLAKEGLFTDFGVRRVATKFGELADDLDGGPVQQNPVQSSIATPEVTSNTTPVIIPVAQPMVVADLTGIFGPAVTITDAAIQNARNNMSFNVHIGGQDFSVQGSGVDATLTFGGQDTSNINMPSVSGNIADFSIKNPQNNLPSHVNMGGQGALNINMPGAAVQNQGVVSLAALKQFNQHFSSIASLLGSSVVPFSNISFDAQGNVMIGTSIGSTLCSYNTVTGMVTAVGAHGQIVIPLQAVEYAISTVQSVFGNNGRLSAAGIDVIPSSQNGMDFSVSINTGDTTVNYDFSLTNPADGVLSNISGAQAAISIQAIGFAVSALQNIAGSNNVTATGINGITVPLSAADFSLAVNVAGSSFEYNFSSVNPRDGVLNGIGSAANVKNVNVNIFGQAMSDVAAFDVPALSVLNQVSAWQHNDGMNNGINAMSNALASQAQAIRMKKALYGSDVSYVSQNGISFSAGDSVVVAGLLKSDENRNECIQRFDAVARFVSVAAADAQAGITNVVIVQDTRKGGYKAEFGTVYVNESLFTKFNVVEMKDLAGKQEDVSDAFKQVDDGKMISHAKGLALQISLGIAAQSEAVTAITSMGVKLIEQAKQNPVFMDVAIGIANAGEAALGQVRKFFDQIKNGMEITDENGKVRTIRGMAFDQTGIDGQEAKGENPLFYMCETILKNVLLNTMEDRVLNAVEGESTKSEMKDGIADAFETALNDAVTLWSNVIGAFGLGNDAEGQNTQSDMIAAVKGFLREVVVSMRDNMSSTGDIWESLVKAYELIMQGLRYTDRLGFAKKLRELSNGIAEGLLEKEATKMVSTVANDDASYVYIFDAGVNESEQAKAGNDAMFEVMASRIQGATKKDAVAFEKMDRDNTVDVIRNKYPKAKVISVSLCDVVDEMAEGLFDVSYAGVLLGKKVKSAERDFARISFEYIHAELVRRGQGLEIDDNKAVKPKIMSLEEIKDLFVAIGTDVHKSCLGLLNDRFNKLQSQMFTSAA